MKRAFALLAVALCLVSACGCSPSDPSITSSVFKIRATLEETVKAMSIEELVGQCFLARCPEKLQLEDIKTYKLGGYVLFGRDFSGLSPEEAKAKIAADQSAADIPLLIAVDEEGGTVNRVSCYSQYRETPFSSPKELFAKGGFGAVENETVEKARLLTGLGINVNLAPVCDITDEGCYMYDRSFADTPTAVSELVRLTVGLSRQNGIGSVLRILKWKRSLGLL